MVACLVTRVEFFRGELDELAGTIWLGEERCIVGELVLAVMLTP